MKKKHYIIPKLPPWTPFERMGTVLGDPCYVNSRYQVTIRDLVPVEGTGFPPMVELSIKRRDREPIYMWREMQRIKNELVGPKNEAVQLFPSEERLVDTANQFFLFVLKDPAVMFPFGFRERAVSEIPMGLPGHPPSRNQPWEEDERPPDLETGEQAETRIRERLALIQKEHPEWLEEE